MVSQKPKYCKNFERNGHWRILTMIMMWERYCNASPKPEFFLFSLFIFSFISQLIIVRLDWNFHRWFSTQKQVNWCTIDPVSLKFCTSQHSYPVPLRFDIHNNNRCMNESYTGWPKINGTVDTVDFSGLCSDQQLYFFTLLDRASFLH